MDEVSKSKELGDYIDWAKLEIDPKIQKQIKEFFEDLTTLTINTVGSDGEEIVTRIKLQGDVYSKTTLKGDKLVEFHERMANASVNLIKTYAQIAIATISIFLPWAGLKLDTEALKTLKEAFSQISIAKQQ